MEYAGEVVVGHVPEGKANGSGDSGQFQVHQMWGHGEQKEEALFTEEDQVTQRPEPALRKP